MLLLVIDEFYASSDYEEAILCSHLSGFIANLFQYLYNVQEGRIVCRRILQIFKQ